MPLPTQAILTQGNIQLQPLTHHDFEALYAVASDPKIWEQHPSHNRWQRNIFETYFEGAMASHGAYKIVDNDSGNIMGCTRYYDYNEQDNSIFIGYTFYATQYWGKKINPAVKALMLNHIFEYVNRVYFAIGGCNTRSQIAIGRIGAIKLREENIAYVGEASNLNFIYCIEKANWKAAED